MDEANIRAWWSYRQALDGRLVSQSSATVLQQTGWARSVGGAAPYLTLFSRGGVRRTAADQAVSAMEIHELPAARGCTYVVPAADFALALKAGQDFADSEMKVARKLGVTDDEVAKLGDAVLKGLRGGPLEPEQLREAVGSAARNLGEQGKKRGVTTTLPLALGKLQAEGRIRRVPINGRLDQQRYRYSVWNPNPLATFQLPMSAVYTELARRYFSWIGPATLAEFQWFSGLGVKASKAAVEPLHLEQLAPDDNRLMLPGDREKLEAFRTSADPHYVLVSSLDGIHLLRRDLRGLLKPEHRPKCVPVDGHRLEVGGLTDLPAHAILDRGCIVGLWEYDPEAEAVVALSFIGENSDLLKAIKHTEQFIQSDLGDARSFSLDSPKSRRPRLDALRHAVKAC